MNTETKELPEYFLVRKDLSDPLWNKYVIWILSKYPYEKLLLSYAYLGIHKLGGIKECNNTEGYPIITLEQWDAAVNKKEEIMHHDVENGMNGTIYSAKIEPKQPKLKVCDKIPEYLDNKLQFRQNDGAYFVDLFRLKSEYIVDFVSSEEYRVSQDGSGIFGLLISDVDALIEEHEMKEQECKNTLRNVAAKLTEEWIPKNGDEVFACDSDEDTGFNAIYIGINPHGITYPHVVMSEKSKAFYVQKAVRKRGATVTKPHSEIAELVAPILGISKEQLKIVEG